MSLASGFYCYQQQRSDKLNWKDRCIKVRAFCGRAFSQRLKMKFLLLAAFLIVSASAEMTRFDNYQVYKVNVENNEQLKALQYLDEHSDSVNNLSLQ